MWAVYDCGRSRRSSTLPQPELRSEVEANIPHKQQAALISAEICLCRCWLLVAASRSTVDICQTLYTTPKAVTFGGILDSNVNAVTRSLNTELTYEEPLRRERRMISCVWNDFDDLEHTSLYLLIDGRHEIHIRRQLRVYHQKKLRRQLRIAVQMQRFTSMFSWKTSLQLPSAARRDLGPESCSVVCHPSTVSN